MIQDATFVSIWDDCTEISSKCKVNIKTHEVFDIEMVDVSDYDIDCLTDEFIVLSDDSFHDVVYISDDNNRIYYLDHTI